MRRIPPAVSVFIGGFVFYSLPAGAFGAHDVAVRAVICGATTAVTAVLLLLLRRKQLSEPPRENERSSEGNLDRG